MQLKWPMLWDLFSLFPAYAGVILAVRTVLTLDRTFPRIRGGDPIDFAAVFLFNHFSPHTRG